MSPSIDRKKLFWGLGVVLLVGAIAVSVYLIQIRQIFRGQASEETQNQEPSSSVTYGEVDLTSKTGEFIIEDSQVNAQGIRQIFLEGSYDPGKREIILTPVESYSTVPPEYDPHLPEPSNSFPLTVKMISGGGLYIEKEIYIVKDENKGPIPFETYLPYLQTFDLEVYERQTHITSQHFEI